MEIKSETLPFKSADSEIHNLLIPFLNNLLRPWVYFVIDI